MLSTTASEPMLDFVTRRQKRWSESSGSSFYAIVTHEVLTTQPGLEILFSGVVQKMT